MQDLIKQEQFELEVLDLLNSRRFLSKLVFGGGTMLRLCFGLERFSVDLDFWLTQEFDTKDLYKSMKDYLSEFYSLNDAANKFHTILLEIKSKEYPRNLKIEIRKEKKKIKTEQAIAYSQYSNKQILLKVVSLPDMMKAKIDAFLNRGEIRDLFDMEFLIRKGIPLDASAKTAMMMSEKIERLRKVDYTVKLGSLIESKNRKYYTKENFKILKSALNSIMNNT